MAADPVGERPAYWLTLKPSPVTTKLPADRSAEDPATGSSAPMGAALGRAPGYGVRGVEHPPAPRSCGGPENRGSEGARPPASLRR